MASVQPITDVKQWQELFAGQGPVMIFKHSTSCGISAEVHERFYRWARALPEGSLRLAQVRVIEERPISQQIAADTGVLHKSPQVILINRGKVLWHTSHLAITEQALAKAVTAAGINSERPAS